MAEAIAAARHPAPGVVFESAGTGALGGLPASDHALIALEEMGVSAVDHRSRVLPLRFEEPPDLIYVMEHHHRDELTRRYPDLATRVELLDPDRMPISDPYGRDLATYRTARDHIAAAVAARAGEWGA
jgi:protein-tyrosine-phosphatase